MNVDLYRDDGYLVAEMELPGIDPQNVELKVYEDRMTIKAERIQEKRSSPRTITARSATSERSRASFRSQFWLTLIAPRLPSKMVS